MKLRMEHLLYAHCMKQSEGEDTHRMCVTIQEDFSWHLLYRKHQVDKDSCSILRDVPSEINTGRWM